jgi:hypothetical protein
MFIDKDVAERLADLWLYDLNTNQWTWIQGTTNGTASSYGSLGVASSLTYPGGRLGHVMVAHPSMNALILHGGLGYGLDGTCKLILSFFISILLPSWIPK